MISESKIDSFPDDQFFLDIYSTQYKLNQNRNGGGIMLFARNDVPSNMIPIEKLPIESFLVELNLRKKGSLLIAFTISIMGILNLIWTPFPRA